MNLARYILILLLSLLPIITFGQNNDESVIVLPIKMQVPADAKNLGTIKVGNNSTATDCDYKELINTAKEKALKMGGNLVIITKLIDPVFISKCYKIEADVYYIKEMPDYKRALPENTTSADTQKHNYALLCIYRLGDTLALQAAYNLHMDNDSVICRIKSKSRDSVKIYKQGPVNLWAETEQKTTLKLNVQTGSVYYIRCGLVRGQIRMVPVLELMDNETGSKEYGKGGKKKKINEIKYLSEIH